MIKNSSLSTTFCLPRKNYDNSSRQTRKSFCLENRIFFVTSYVTREFLCLENIVQTKETVSFFLNIFIFFNLQTKQKQTHGQSCGLPIWCYYYNGIETFFKQFFCNFFQTIFNNAIFVPLLGAFVTVRGLDCWEFEIEHKVKQCLEI